MKKVIYLCLAVGALFGGYFLLTTKVNRSISTQGAEVPQEALSIASTTEALPNQTNEATNREVPEGLKEYKNNTYHLSLLYPVELSMSFYDEGQGQATMVFQNIEKKEGFQIFITPYNEKQISNDRFMKDEPSGVRLSPLEVKIDGVEATSFFGKDNLIGDTAEIWFINNGYLYEASAPKSQVNWFGNIMQTFKFE